MNYQKLSQRRRRAYWAKLDKVCVYCGATKQLSLDHKIPRAEGGANSFSNIQVLCQSCNHKKGKTENPNDPHFIPQAYRLLVNHSLMAAPLVIPDHIKQARLDAIAAGICCGTTDHTTAVLLFAAVAYARTPQVNKAEMLRQDYEQAQRKLEAVSSDLLAERKKTQHLTAELATLRAAPTAKVGQKEAPYTREEKQEIMRLKAEIGSLRHALENSDYRQRYKEAMGHKRGLRTHMRHIQDTLSDNLIMPEQKLLLLTGLVNDALVIGTPAEAERFNRAA